MRDELFWTFRVLKFNRGEIITHPVEIYPMAPFLSPGEEIVWNNILTKGIINRKITWIDLVTNYRIYQYDYVNHAGNFILIPAIEEVVVSNQRRIADSNRYGTYTKSKYAISGYGKAKTTSTLIGDVSIFALGKPYIVFRGISDPNGVTKLIKSINKQCNFTIDTDPFIENNETVIERTHENIINKSKDTLNNQNEIICENCNNLNIRNSKFCGQCGVKIIVERKCIQCGNVNMIDAVFCNQCGNKLTSLSF